METLSSEELVQLVQRVFEPAPDERRLAVMVDLPDAVCPDREPWAARRAMAAGWVRRLRDGGLSADLVLYRNAHRNNADLPARAFFHRTGPLPQAADELDPGEAVPMADILRDYPLILAPTELSATAPLKLAAPEAGFRAATMPGFSAAMVPALRLDYREINRRVHLLKDLLDRAVSAHLVLTPAGHDPCELTLDLRHRAAHASGGLLPRRGTAGNLPSGETYIVPYEGEVPGDPSRSAGVLPVQFGDEVVRYEVRENRAVRVLDDGPEARREAELLAKEPGYANIAELGLGVLADFGVQPCGAILLDEKLGLHVAFGRSDHFGGQVGAAQFSSPDAVVHIDRVYLPQVQPRVAVTSVDLTVAGAAEPVRLMEAGRYTLDFR